MIDVLITTYNRKEMLKETVESFIEKNSGLKYRLFIIDDYSGDGTQEYLRSLNSESLGFVVLSRQRLGVVYGFDMLWNMVDFFDGFYDEFPYMCYLQDDMRSDEKNWVLTLIQYYETLKERCKIGFFSGYDAPEHPVESSFFMDGRMIVLKKSQGASNLIAEKSFWRSIGYIPKFNPDGSRRGYPDTRKGSHIDLYLTGCMSGSKFVAKASAFNSSYNQGKKILVLPNLLKHLGEDRRNSTWRK